MKVYDFPSYLHELVFKDDATAQELFIITLTFSVFWGIFFQLGTPVLRKLTYGKPWLRRSCEREYERVKDQLEEWGMGDRPKDEIVDEWMKEWAWGQIMTVQHLGGALLCIPSLLRLGGSDQSWANSLAVCGILSEMGWEIEHSLETLYTRLFTPNGEKKVPNISLIFLTLHHSLTSIMGLPSVLHYRGLKALHWLCFDLQFGASFGLLIEYSKMLDITKPNDLRKFKLVNVIILVLNLWTRLFHWVYLSIAMITTWYHDDAWLFLGIGSVMVTLFSVFNAFISVIPSYKRYMKFRHASADYESLPADASAEERRKSTIALKAIVDEIMLEDTTNTEEQIYMFLESLEKRPKLNRRQSMPPIRRRRSTFGRKRMLAFASAPAQQMSDLMKED